MLSMWDTLLLYGDLLNVEVKFPLEIHRTRSIMACDLCCATLDNSPTESFRIGVPAVAGNAAGVANTIAPLELLGVK